MDSFLIQKFRRVRHALGRISSKKPPQLDPLEAYELWASTYDDNEGNALLFAETRVIQPLLEESQLQNKDILDAGCGTGRYLQALQHCRPRSIAAVDFSPQMIARAKGKINNSVPVSFHVARVEQLPFEDLSFDFILCTLVLGHVENLENAFRQLSRVLRQDGRIVISCFHPFGQLLGWERTFRTNDNTHPTTLAVKYFGHLHSDYLNCFMRSGLQIVRMEEPTVDASLSHFYQRAGRLDLYRRSEGYPLLLILEGRKE